jgi:hypothetical protein
MLIDERNVTITPGAINRLVNPRMGTTQGGCQSQAHHDQRRALAMIAGAGPRGVTEPLLVDGHGFAVELLVSLVRATLASVAFETMRSGGRVVEETRLRITDAGRRALATNPH